jgi:dTDP-4-amino-4,6-dideoxygalactose transaminase
VKTTPTTKKPRPAAARRSGQVRRIPQLDLQRQYAGIQAEVTAALARVCGSQRFILGEEVAAFEREISAFTGAATTVACASGTDALWLALVAAGVQPGDEVLTTAFSFIASATAIARAGARPVLADIDPLTLNLDPAQAEHKVNSALTSRLRAILAVHLYGQCAPMDALQRLAAGAKLVLLEDAAQSFGGAWRGQRAGSLGTAAALSFYPTKNLGAFGDAGAVTTSEPGLAERMLSLRNHGMRERYRHDEMGWNSRLDALQAAVLRVKLKRVVEWNQRRNQVAETYTRLFTKAGLAARRSAAQPSPVQVPHTLAEAYHAWHQYVIRAERRDELRHFLAERGVGTEVYYPIPMHLQQCFLYLGYTEGSFPEAERAAREVLALPMFPELEPDEQEYVVSAIAQFYS